MAGAAVAAAPSGSARYGRRAAGHGVAGMAQGAPGPGRAWCRTVSYQPPRPRAWPHGGPGAGTAAPAARERRAGETAARAAPARQGPAAAVAGARPAVAPGRNRRREALARKGGAAGLSAEAPGSSARATREPVAPHLGGTAPYGRSTAALSYRARHVVIDGPADVRGAASGPPVWPIVVLRSRPAS